MKLFTKKNIFGTIGIVTALVGAFVFGSGTGPVTAQRSTGGIVTSSPFRQSANVVLLRITTRDVAFDNAATPSAGFFWDASANKLTLTDLEVTGVCTNCGEGGATSLTIKETFGDVKLSGRASLSFDGGKFSITASGSADVGINLDWGPGGPASLSQNEIVTGNWSFTNASASLLEVTNTASISVLNLLTPLTDANVANALTINGGTVTWTDLTSYPTGCTNQFVTTVGDTLTCATVDISDDTNLAGGTDLTLSDDTLNLDSTLTQAFTFSNTGSQTFTGSIEVSKGIHALAAFTAVGSTSANGGFNGSGLVDCNTANTSKLLWDQPTGKFSCGTDQDTGSFDATTVDAETWSDGANASNIWTYDLSGVDPTITFQNDGFLFTGNASVSKDFEVDGLLFVDGTGSSSLAGSFTISKGLTANSYQSGGLTGCVANGNVLQYAAGQFSCATLADADIPNNITIDLATLATTLTITDNESTSETNAIIFTAGGDLDGGDLGLESDGDLTYNPSTGNISATQFGGITEANLVDKAATETISGTWTFSALTQFTLGASSSTNFEAVGYASASQYFGGKAEWSMSIASTSNEFNNGGRINLPRSGEHYVITEIYCDVEAGTSIVINVSNRGGNFDSETVTCDLDGASDTSIGTNADYTGFTIASSSLEIGTITGTVNWLNVTIVRKRLP